MPEIASLVMNLTAIDNLDVLEHLIQIKLPTVIFQLIATTFPQSFATTSFCLDSLCNLVEAFQEPDLFDKI
jgi:hypothetical protein